MRGRIRTKERCPVCKKAFQATKHPVTKDTIDLMCPDHLTRPRKVFIDARAFGAGKLYHNEKGRLFDSFAVAYRQLEEMRKRVDDHTFAPEDYLPGEIEKYRLRRVAGLWLERVERSLSFSYFRHSKTEMERHILPAVLPLSKMVMGDMDIRDMRTSHTKELVDVLEDKGLSKKSQENIVGTLSSCLHNYSDDIPRMPKFPKIVVPEKERGWINREKQMEILSAIPDRHRLIFETLIETAERPGEVCAHKKKDLIDGEIAVARAFDEKGRVKETKSGTVHYRGISLALWNKLTEHAREKLPDSWLFLDEHGQPYSRDKLYRIWKRACKQVSVMISLSRGTRHSRVSQKRLEKEKEVAEACRQELEHASSSTTMRHYARPRSEEIK